MKSSLKGLIKRTGLTREHVAAARMRLERNALAALPHRSPRNSGRILCYHAVGQPELGVNDISPALFQRQIEMAIAAGYRFVPALDIALTGGGPKDLAITFDDALKSLRTTAAPILKDFAIPWAFFAVSDWCETGHPWGPDVVLSWREIEALAAAGVHVGSHSATHADFGRIPPAEAQEELSRSREMIERRLGFAPTTFAIPLGQSMNWTPAAGDLALKAGYEVIYAQAENTRPADTVARTFVTRFDNDRIFRALLQGAYDNWEEWV